MCIGLPGQVLAVEGGLATVEMGGARRTVNAALLEDLRPGDWIIVHMGFALDRIAPDDAREALRALDADLR